MLFVHVMCVPHATLALLIPAERELTYDYLLVVSLLGERSRVSHHMRHGLIMEELLYWEGESGD